MSNGNNTEAQDAQRQHALEKLLWRMGEPSDLWPAPARAAVVAALGGVTEQHPLWLAFNWILNRSLAMERAAAAADGTRYPRVVAVEELQFALAQLKLETQFPAAK